MHSSACLMEDLTLQSQTQTGGGGAPAKHVLWQIIPGRLLIFAGSGWGVGFSVLFVKVFFFRRGLSNREFGTEGEGFVIMRALSRLYKGLNMVLHRSLGFFRSLEVKAWGPECRVLSVEFVGKRELSFWGPRRLELPEVQGLGFRVQGLGFRV